MVFKGKLRKVISIALLVCYILLSSTITQSAKENVSIQADSSKVQNETGINKIVNTQSNSSKEDKTPERIIVKFKDSSKADTIKNNVKSKLKLNKLNKLNKLDSKRKIKKTNIEVLEVNKSDLDITINGFKENSEVEYVQPDYLLSVDSIPQDERFGEQWGLYNSGQTINGQVGTSGIDVSAIEAWDVSTSGENVTVGVLDTGIDISHVDIDANIYINPNEIPNDGIDNDSNGYIDDINGFDFANNDNTVYDSATYDKHGTHIAGIIAGKADNLGIRGVASNVKVMPLKFINGATGYTSDAIEAIEYAKSMGIKIINCSFGSTYNSPALLDAMQNSSMLFACAAGNSGVNIDNSPIYPACFNLPNVISVGAIDNTGNLASFSNYGSKVNVVAPGKDILSTIPENCYEYMSGTSMSTPFVTGAIALLSKSAEQLSNEQIKTKLFETATTIVGSNSYNYRLVNIARSLGVVDNTITPTPSATPAPIDAPEKPQPSFDIIQKDVQFAEYRDKLKALEEQASNSANISIAKAIEGKLNNLIIKENKLRELSENYVVESKDQAELTSSQSAINSYYSTNALGFYNLEVEYQNLINEYVDIVQGNSAVSTMSQTLTVNNSINVTLPVGNSQVFEFTAPNSSTYVFQTGPYMGTGSPNDTVLEIYTDAALTNRVAIDDDSAGNLFSKVSIFISNNVTYYIKVSPYKSTGAVYAKLSVVYDESSFSNINLNSSIDVSLSTGEFKVFKFTPTSTQTYDIFTGPYAGTGGSNDTYLEIYTDAALTNKIAYNDDSAGNLFSIISTTLNAGTKYYIKLRHYSTNGAVYARLTLQQNISNLEQVVILNSPVNVNLGMGLVKIFKYTPTSGGTYNIFTGPYSGTGLANDTYLELYSDAGLTNRLAYDDDSAGNLFSKIQTSLSLGETYYIKLAPYNNSGYIHSNFTITKETPVVTVNLNQPVDLQVAQSEYAICKFTPSVTGQYKLFTSSNASVAGSNDTWLELHTNQALTNMIAYDDDSGGNLYSLIQYNLNAGTTYYIKFRGWSNSSACGSFAINLLSDTIEPSDPTNLTSSYTTSTTTNLSWTASTDNVEVATYDVYKDGIYLATTAATNYNVTGLTPATTYKFTIKAKDVAGNISSASNEVSVATLVLSQITATITYDIAAQTISINGNNPTGQGKQITILVKDPSGAIKYIDQLLSGTNGAFSLTFKINTTVVGIYTVTIGGEGITTPFNYNFTITNLSLPDTTAPTTPTNLVSSNTTATTTDLTWTASMDNLGVVGYDVYNNGVYLATTANTNFQVTGLTPTATYIFSVKAKDSANNTSVLSNETTVKTIDVVAPTAPILATPNPESTTGTTINLTWQASTDNVGVVGYDIYKNGTFLATTVSTNYAVTGLIASNSYKFKLKSKDLAGNVSAESNEITVTPMLVNAITANVNYNEYRKELSINGSASNGQGKQITILVKDPNGAIKYIDQLISGTNGAFSLVFKINPTVVGVYTVSIGGDGITTPFNNNFTIIDLSTTDTTPPTAPTNLISSVRTGTTIDLSWGASTDNVGVVGYDVYKNGTYLATTITASYKVVDLLSTESYQFIVKAKDAVGNISASSNEITVKTTDVVAPTVPTGLVSNNITETTIDLNWAVSTDNVGVVGYDIYKDGVYLATTANTNYQVIGLSIATTYKFTLKAKDGAGNISDASIEFAVTTLDTIPPTVPTNLVASNITGTTVNLSWSASTDNVGVVGYDIYKDGAYLATTANISYQVTGLTSVTTYKFTIKAKDAAANLSDASNEVTVVTLDAIPPTAPTDLLTSNMTGTTVDLSWSASTDNVGVVGYDIYKDGVFLVSTTNINYQITGLTSATTYKFTVKAKDLAGNISDASNEVTITTLDTIPPTAPTNLVASNITGTTADLSWTASTDNVGVVGYDIYRDGVFLTTTENVSYQVTGLTSVKTYKFTVKAKDMAGNISDASEVTVITLDTIPPTAPTNLLASNITGTTADLSWTASTDNVGVTGYNIYKDGVFLATAANVSYLVTGLTSAKTYKFTVKAKDLAGNISNASNEVTVTTLDTIPPTSPTSLLASNITGTTAGLNWTASTDNVGVVGYEIYKNGVKLEVPIITATNYQATGLIPSTIYKFTVKAKDLAGKISGASNEAILTTLDTIPPTAPTNLVASNITGATVDLSWTASTDNVGVVGYEIYKDGVYLSTTANANYQVMGLMEATTYKFTVKAKDFAGNISDTSNEVTILPIPTEEITANIIVANATVTVNGTTSAGIGKAVTILVKGPGANTNIVYINQIESTSSNYEFKFTMPSSASSGEYTALIGGEGVLTPINKTFLYNSSVITPNIINTLALNIPINLSQVYGSTQQVLFNATAAPVANIDLSTIEWYVNDVKQATTGSSFSYTPTNVGSYVVSVKVSNNSTALVDSKTISVVEGGAITAQVNVNANVVTVDGSTNAGVGKAVTILVRGPGANNNIVYINQGISDGNKNFKFIFTMPSTAESGEYSVLMGGDGVISPKSEQFIYSAPIVAILQSINFEINPSELPIGGTYSTVVNAVYSNGMQSPISSGLTFNISGSGAVTADTITGDVTATKLGYITITVSYQGITSNPVVLEVIPSPATISAEIDYNTKQVRLSGNVQTGAFKTVSIQVSKSSGEIDNSQQVICDEYGNYELKYILDETVDEHFTVTVTNEDLFVLKSSYFDYVLPPISSVMKSNLNTQRRDFGLALVNNKIYVIGGCGEQGILNTVEMYDISNPSAGWVYKSSMVVNRESIGVTVVNGKIYAIGGHNNTGILNTIEEYSPENDSWTIKNTTLIAPRANLKAVAINDKIFIIGGFNSGGQLKSMEEYDPATQLNKTITRQDMTIARDRFGAVVVNNMIYIVGGFSKNSSCTKLEYYNPTLDQWTSSQSTLPTKRIGASICVIGQDIYVIGGWDGYGIVDTVDKYNTSNAVWSNIGYVSNPKVDCGITVINGKINILGGYNGKIYNAVEEYDIP